MVVKLMCFFTILLGGFMTQQTQINSLSEVFSTSSEIIVTFNNEELSLKKGDQKFEDIVKSMLETLLDSHEMPAFGVSLDKETRKARAEGLWIEFVFDSEKSYNEMPFESLLIEIKKDYSGFNVIRKYNGKYEGRCFYFDLKGDMSKIDTAVRNIVENKI